MCDYCEKGKTLAAKVVEVAKECFGSIVEYEDEYIVFIRGNTIRLGEKSDCQCIEAVGYAIINFCPMCGKELK